MGFNLRDKNRYGIFKAHSPLYGDVKVEISISGFGERITITPYKGTIYGHSQISINTLDDEDEFSETDDELYICGVKIEKPFIRCLKRYK